MAIDKYCHQCRHMKRCYGSCVGGKRVKGCQVMYCEPCLHHRYKQNATEVDLDTNWTCFKCRGICNCSSCPGNRGLKPPRELKNVVEPGQASSAGERLGKEGCSNENALAGDDKMAAKGKAIATTSTRTMAAPKNKEEPAVEVKLPEGSSLIEVLGMELPPEDVGDIFHFLEFCLAFEQVLDLKKGQSNCIIREIYEKSSTISHYSTVTQMITQLLTVILEDKKQSLDCLTTTDESWFTVLGECLEKSNIKFDSFSPEMFQKGNAEFEILDPSKKLMLLNFLCDETLGTLVMRKFIDDQILEHKKTEMQAKEKIQAAKKKEEQLKQKLQDELARAEREKGLSLTRDERVTIISKIEAEIAEAHFEMLDAVRMKKSLKNDDGIINNPILSDGNGRAFWKLKSYNDGEDILLQDLGSISEVCPREKWLAFTPEQKPEVEAYLASKRTKRTRAKKRAESIPESP